MFINKNTPQLKSKKFFYTRNIYDCFMFFNELEILKLRLEYLWPYVDYFIIVESRKTVQGRTKPLFFEENKEKFKHYSHKIKHLIVDDFPPGVAPHTMETIQRNAMISCLKSCKDRDFIMISDIDELPNLNQMPENLRDGVVYHFLQDQHIYFANIYKEKHIIWEGGTKIVTYKTIRENLLSEAFVHYRPTFLREYNLGPTLTKIRLYRKTKFIYNGGYHLTYLGGVSRIMKKLKSFSHPELIESGKFNKEFITKSFSKGLDIGIRGEDISRSPQKIYRMPETDNLELFRKHLPVDFFNESCGMQNKLIYQLNRNLEILIIIIRSLFRISYLVIRGVFCKLFKKSLSKSSLT